MWQGTADEIVIVYLGNFLWGLQESVAQSEKTIAAAENEMTKKEGTDE